MTIHDVAQGQCIVERSRVAQLYDSFVADLEKISNERGLLLQDATFALEQAAADKLRNKLMHRAV